MQKTKWHKLLIAKQLCWKNGGREKENRKQKKTENKKDCTAVKVILKYQLPKKYCNQSVKKKKKIQ